VVGEPGGLAVGGRRTPSGRRGGVGGVLGLRVAALVVLGHLTAAAVRVGDNFFFENLASY